MRCSPVLSLAVILTLAAVGANPAHAETVVRINGRGTPTRLALMAHGRGQLPHGKSVVIDGHGVTHKVLVGTNRLHGTEYTWISSQNRRGARQEFKVVDGKLEK